MKRFEIVHWATRVAIGVPTMPDALIPLKAQTRGVFLSARQGFVDINNAARYFHSKLELLLPHRLSFFFKFLPITRLIRSVVHLLPFYSFLTYFACLILLGGCALIGGSTDIEHASAYVISAPSDWTLTNRGESDKAYVLPSGNRVSLVSSCNRDPEAPLEILTRHLLMGTRNVGTISRQKRKIGGNDGLYSKVTARLEGKPFHLEIFVTAQNRCVFDFSLVSPGSIPEADTASFESFIRSFSFAKH
jgi:hypothetical protein